MDKILLAALGLAATISKKYMIQTTKKSKNEI